MNDSYSATRIQVMRTKLIKHAEYEHLLKMSESEIIAFLQATEYKQDIDALALRDFEDLEVIDKIIARNNDRMLAKLQKISSRNFRIALNLFLEENDAWNLKIIAESIVSKHDAREMLQRYAKKGTFDPSLMAGAKTIEELSKLASKFVPVLHKHPATLPNFIDTLNMRRREHMPQLIDEENILRLLMHKREKMQVEQIMERMSKGGTIPRSALRIAATAENVEAAVQVLRTTKYGKALQKDSMTGIESALRHEIVQRIRKAAGIYPLQAEVLIRYLAEKDIEIANLRLLIKGKHLGLEEEFLREQLVI
jgi:V/A-type H+/Na+-transporting ATPase subunit C